MVIPRGRDGARSGRAGYLPEIPSPRRSPFAYYLYKLRAYFISLTRDHNGRHRSVFFSCGPPLSNSLRLTPPPCGHANGVDARASGGLAHCVERSITPALTGAEGRGLCWQACPVLNQARLPPLGARRARGRVRAVARPTASSAASFPTLSGVEGQGLCWLACLALKQAGLPPEG